MPYLRSFLLTVVRRRRQLFGGPGGPDNVLLQEDGTSLLLENGDNILLES